MAKFYEDTDPVVQALEDVLQTLRRSKSKRTRPPVTVALLDSGRSKRKSVGKRRPATEGQLRGLLLHRTVQRDHLDSAIRGIGAKLRAMGVEPDEIEWRTWPSRSCELKPQDLIQLPNIPTNVVGFKPVPNDD